MLKILSQDEADAVLGHELAHFSGQDTFWSRKISPLRGKFILYMQHLSGGFTVVVTHFMHAFWKLYEYSLSRLSREREFRADSVGEEVVSADAMKRALIKVTSYCVFRHKTEMALIQKQRVDPSLQLSRKLAEEYPTFLISFLESGELLQDSIPPPFDTHPTLRNRLSQLGQDPETALQDSSLSQPEAGSWYYSISTAPALEEKLWDQQQKVLQAYHSMDLVYRLLPSDEEEEEEEEEADIVREHFPDLAFRDKKGNEAHLDFAKIKLAEWSESIAFKDINKVELKDCLSGGSSSASSITTVKRRKPEPPSFIPRLINMRRVPFWKPSGIIMAAIKQLRSAAVPPGLPSQADPDQEAPISGIGDSTSLPKSRQRRRQAFAHPCLGNIQARAGAA